MPDERFIPKTSRVNEPPKHPRPSVKPVAQNGSSNAASEKPPARTEPDDSLHPDFLHQDQEGLFPDTPPGLFPAMMDKHAASIALLIPNTGLGWLDDMIRQARLLNVAQAAMQSVITFFDKDEDVEINDVAEWSVNYANGLINDVSRMEPLETSKSQPDEKLPHTLHPDQYQTVPQEGMLFDRSTMEDAERLAVDLQKQVDELTEIIRQACLVDEKIGNKTNRR